MKYILIHGSFGAPNENWFPWLNDALVHKGNEVIIPAFPTPEGQSLESWREVFAPYEKELDDQTIVIGHSLGVAFVLDVLQRVPHKIQAAHLVSGFTGLLGNETFDTVNQTFVKRDFDWEIIKDAADNFHVYHGDNDPYVPVKMGLDLARRLGVGCQIIADGGHLNSATGFDRFEMLDFSFSNKWDEEEWTW